MIHHFACAFLPAAVFGGAVAGNMSLEKTVYTTPLQLLVAGNFAVCIFFVLSGFVLSHKYFQTRDHEVIKSGAIRRYFRLMPPVLASILIAYVLMKLNVFYNHQAAAISGSSSWLNIYWTTIPAFGSALWQGIYGVIVGNSDPGIFNNVLWTMKIEFFGSMVVFGFLALFGNMNRRWIAYALAVLVTFNTYYLAFVIGIAISDFVASKRSPDSLPARVTVPMGLFGLFLGAAPIPSNIHTIYSGFEYIIPPHGLDIVMLMHTAGASLVMAALLYSPLLKDIFSKPLLQYLGRVSFSLYLIHVLVIGTVSSYVFIKLTGLHHYSLQVGVTFVATLLVAFMAAELFTRKVDQRAIRFSGLFYSRLFKLGPTAKAKVEPILASGYHPEPLRKMT